MKNCRVCKIELVVGENWNKSYSKRDDRICKGCLKEYREENKEMIKEYYEENKEKII